MPAFYQLKGAGSAVHFMRSDGKAGRSYAVSSLGATIDWDTKQVDVTMLEPVGGQRHGDERRRLTWSIDRIDLAKVIGALIEGLTRTIHDPLVEKAFRTDLEAAMAFGEKEDKNDASGA